MFGKEISLFKLFGFAVKVDLSWLFIAVLITWSLAEGYFPQHLKELTPLAYWTMGIIGALGLFASIIFHEFWHSLVARRYGLPMKGITLFIFGGISEMSEEPRDARTEFMMAAAGPVSSLVLGGFFYLVYRLGKGGGWPESVNGVLGYLAFINWILAAFNLLPAFPLDGGRILRSGLWKWKGDLKKATRTASNFGSGFGIVLIGLGVLSFFSGNPIGGLWYCIIGLFLRNAAKMSYRQVLIRDALAGEKVADLMNPNPVTVPPDISLQQLVEDYVLKFHFKMFPVVAGENLLGCITSVRIKEIPREEWKNRRVEEAAFPCSDDNTVTSDTPASRTLSLMNRSGNSRLMVVQSGKLVGVISLKDILGSLSLRMEFEEEEE
jgi:Zn-dependent protease/predicted transcriptional regulator